MKVTKEVLLHQRTNEEEEKVKLEAKCKKNQEEYLAKKEAEDFLWVETCLESSLGEALKKAEHQKLNCIILDGTRVWREAHVSGFGKRNDLYWKIDGMFVFDPEYAPTKKLIEVLKEAGFNVKLETEFEQNYTYVTSADGYDVVDAPGHHPVHYLEISW